ncbi:NTF2-related export protein 2-like isoform X2 [Pomacea canaliculata]|uniref:NTF2-related export protein 2-like isoform X2 n=1 Tax=Pomacea canaliculata TaxID=400727 RepID=UPI000D72AC1C|nr:NTF2-related export protein 2-like isoform X2 [Pomacea canaliculata]
MAPMEEPKEKAEQALQAATEFAQIFYEYLDKKRNAVRNLYMDTATLLWNGNAISNKDAILKFLEDLPTSEHTLTTLDSQPLVEPVIDGQTSIMVTVFGKACYQDTKAKGFFQTFILTSQGNVWKIVSDTYRFLEA